MNTSTQPSIKAYTRAAHTVAKTRQVVMLYDGVIRFLQQAAEAMERGDVEQRYQKLTRAADVVMGLQSCLDFDSGGPTAQMLYNFYSSIDARIFSLHRQPDAASCRQIIEELKSMRDVWDGIDRGAAKSTSPSVPPEEPPPTSGPVKVSA